MEEVPDIAFYLENCTLAHNEAYRLSSGNKQTNKDKLVFLIDAKFCDVSYRV